MAGESDVIAGPDGAKRISELLRDYFAPEALDSVYQEVVRFSQFGRAAQTTDGFLVRLDLPHKKAASKKQGGEGPFRKYSRRCCAFLMPPYPARKNRRSLPGYMGNLGISAVARQMGRLSGSCARGRDFERG